MLRSLVGSEMCIRDSINAEYGGAVGAMVRLSLGQAGLPSAATLEEYLMASPSAISFQSARQDPGAPATMELAVLQKLSKPEVRAILFDLLVRENELRLSPNVQRGFGQIGEAKPAFDEFVTMLQAHVCREFGVDPSVGVELIRCAVSLFPDDKELHETAHYIKFNRCKRGILRHGDRVADCKVLSMDGTQELRLNDLIPSDRPVVLMGASHT
eukprot:TRINITY_DN36097_c0_g1_i1.p1 TRINITY_DN36097_c0_g1~~TRINITY_DN36097_c0_g1_i1.p1  ORF type:complete len:245 (-),score=76.11 TRINITY_DN36097_c0_g1_i1:756-1394(-)